MSISNPDVADLTYGQVGYLDQHMERKLHETWSRLLKMSGTAESGSRPAANRTAAASKEVTTPDDNTAKENGHVETTAAEEAAARTFRRNLWSSVKAEHPDSIVLRFLRARKCDVDKTLEMFTSALTWRSEVDIERTVVARGEAVALLPSRTEDDEGVLLQYRSGKSYVRGTDKEGRPVYIVKPRLHDPSKQTSKAMEMFILHTIESIRLLVKAPNDRACLIFDMTGFGLRNMDFHAAKYIVDVFEARYPETLGMVLIHNSPLVFSGRFWSSMGIKR